MVNNEGPEVILNSSLKKDFAINPHGFAISVGFKGVT
jgi:hypothetical protein